MSFWNVRWTNSSSAIYLDGIGVQGPKSDRGSGGRRGQGQGASENGTAVGELPADLVERGVDFSVPMLYVDMCVDTAESAKKRVELSD